MCDDDETLVVAVAHLLLERDHLAHGFIGVRALGGDHLLALFRIGVHERRVHLRSFVFQADVTRQHERVLHVSLHIRMSRPVVEDQTLNQFGFVIRLMLHGHDLHHVQIDRLFRFGDAQHSVDDDRRQLISQLFPQLCSQRRARHAQQHFSIRRFHTRRRALERFQKLQRLAFRHIESLHDHSRMQTLIQIPLRLLQQLSDDEHRRRRPVPGDIILRHRRPRDHDRRRVLNLHLSQQHVPILRELQTYAHRFQHRRQSFGQQSQRRAAFARNPTDHRHRASLTRRRDARNRDVSTKRSHTHLQHRRRAS